MTRNKKVIEIAKLHCHPRYWFSERDIEQLGEDTIMGMYISKKVLQAKMVADGWHIVIAQHSPDCFSATAWKDIFEGKKYITEIEHYVQRANTEPAALHALFVKVYNIGGE